MALAKEPSKITTDYKSLNVAIVSAPKVGKTTLASKLGEGVYFAATEKGHDFVSIMKSDIHVWSDFTSLVKDLAAEKHNYKHLVIDTMDNLYQMVSDYVCEINKVKSISDIPYGGGYTAAKKMLVKELTYINTIGLGITFITHEKMVEVKKDSITWTAMRTSLSQSIEETILGMCDLILFCHFDKSNQRVMRTKPNKHIQCAGDRSGKLPEIMPMDAELIFKHLKGEK